MSIHVVSATAPTHVSTHQSAQAPQTHPDAHGTSAAKEPTPVSNSSPSTVVNISTAGKAALQEATETAAQTAVEASRGDHQAQRLLANGKH
jgi:hypothetical protein